jgi:uncharacterized SAM-binding protein YcdF (DUF218 family)
MYDFVVQLFQPYVICFILIGVAIWRMRRRGPDEKPRRLRWLVIPYVSLWILSTEAAAHLVLGTLEWRHPPLAQRPDDAGAIVILGATMIEPGEYPIKAQLDLLSQVRTSQGAAFYHQGSPCLVITSAGPPQPDPNDPACADRMADFLVELGVPPEDIVAEGRSRTTYENAVESAKLLREKGITRVVLVTDAVHLPRSVACFRKQGLEVIPGGTYYEATGWRWKLDKFIPKAEALYSVHRVGHEWVGLLYYWVRGYI